VEKRANCCSQAGRGSFGQDPPSTRFSYDIFYAAEISGNNRSAARHTFEQYIRPALTRGGMHQHIRRGVDFGKALLRAPTQKTHAICNAKLACYCFDTASLWPFPYDCEINLMQVTQC